MMLGEAYHVAQSALANLKAAIRSVLELAPEEGLSNAQIGRTLGIYAGHVGHEGHISRTLLAMLQAEGVAEQDADTRYWRLQSHIQKRVATDTDET